MKNIINEEIGRMLYLTSHKRGIVISEQELRGISGREYSPINIPDWDGGTKGLIKFDTGDKILAKNIKFNDENYNLTRFSDISKKTSTVTSDTTPTDIIPPEIPDLNLSDSSFPYDDNMIQPNFERNLNSKEKYELFVNAIIKYVKRYKNINFIKNITIQGSADSSKPTLKVPSGYIKLDHDIISKNPYDGSTDPYEMNQFLADNRAKVISKLIVDKVKSETGFDITPKIKILKGINYYKPNLKGVEGVKSIVVKTTPEKVQPISGSFKQNKISNVRIINNEPLTGELDLTQWGGPKVQYTEVIDEKTNQVSYGINRKDLDYLVNNNIIVIVESTKFNFKSDVEGKIKNGKLFVDKLDFGSLVSPDNIVRSNDSSVSFVTNPGRYGYFGTRNGLNLIRILRFGLTKV